jgi:hypothetical protein
MVRKLLVGYSKLCAKLFWRKLTHLRFAPTGYSGAAEFPLTPPSAALRFGFTKIFWQTSNIILCCVGCYHLTLYNITQGDITKIF